MRLGGLTLAGAALLAAGALGFQWSFAPAFLRDPWVELGLVGAGIILLVATLFSLGLDLRASMAAARPTSPSDSPLSGSRVTTFPASVVREDSTPEVSAFPLTDAAASHPSSPLLVVPRGTSAARAGASTLLISFSDGPMLGIQPPVPQEPRTTVTGLVDRVNAMQRVSGSNEPATAPLVLPPPPPSRASDLLLRLTRIPSPPAVPRPTRLARRCTDCGETLGYPPQFEPCEECRQALCERCYWRVSSGPRSHFCSTCFRERSIPRPPTRPVTVAGPRPVPSTSGPSGRTPPSPRRGS